MRNIYKILLVLAIGLIFYKPVFAQESFTLSITPPLVKNNVSPGEIWKSSLKLVNNNQEKIDVYVQLMDFKSGSESGTVDFITLPDDLDKMSQHLLSGWIDINEGPYTIEPYDSRNIEYSINIPENAEPGGHYAAILAGTKPPDDKIEGSEIKISSLLGSLLLINVNGDVSEEGRIREFSTDRKLYNKPDVKLTVRFENTGNVHIQPQGEIRIYNHLGKEKKTIIVNHYSDFGNILPNSVRKWNFEWQADDNFWEMGRYKAVLVFGYGEKEHYSEDRTIYFWIINFKLLIISIGSLLLIIFLVIVMIKSYIKRAIKLTQMQAGVTPFTGKNRKKISIIEDNNLETEKPQSAINSISKTIETQNRNSINNREKKIRWGFFNIVIKLIIAFLIILLAFFLYLSYKNNFGFFKKFFDKDTTDVEIIEVEEDPGNIKEFNKETQSTTTNITNLENNDMIEATTTGILEESDISTSTETIINDDRKNIKIRVLNGSGRSGVAGEAADKVKQSGFQVGEVGNADNFDYLSSIIKYLGEYEDEANKIRKLFSFEIEMQETEKQDFGIVIILGGNYE